MVIFEKSKGFCANLYTFVTKFSHLETPATIGTIVFQNAAENQSLAGKTFNHLQINEFDRQHAP